MHVTANTHISYTLTTNTLTTHTLTTHTLTTHTKQLTGEGILIVVEECVEHIMAGILCQKQLIHVFTKSIDLNAQTQTKHYITISQH